MDLRHRIVTRIPLRELWDERGGTLPLARGAVLSADGVKELLRLVPRPRFVVADVGLPLRWLDSGDLFAFWKDQVGPRLVEPAGAEAGFYLGDFPGEYAFIASAWQGSAGPAVVLLETYH